MVDKREPGWLLLIHQIPPKPNYFRVKIWRRLQKLGAVAIKNSVYALPSSDQAQEDLNWVLREIVEGGGDASLVDARLIEGLNDEQVKEMFRAARDADYQAVASEARELARTLPRKGEVAEDKRAEMEPSVARLRKRAADIAAIDFFHARSRETVDGLLSELEQRLAFRESENEPADAGPVERPRRATWVTRTGIHVDRMASAWLIRRFIDPEAKFKFVGAREYRHKQGELRFDMFDGEYTHKGELCTFEVLLQRSGLDDPALMAIGEIVHDIDVRDEKFQRAETAGVRSQITGVATAHRADLERIAAATPIFDALYSFFSQRAERSRRSPGAVPRTGAPLR